MERIDFFGAIGKLKKEYARYLEPVCSSWALTQNELAVLLFLYNNPRRDRAADIVDCWGIAKSHVSLAVSNLERRDIVKRGFDPGDRRTLHLVLTQKGEQIAREGRERQRLFFAELYAGITPEELEQLRLLNGKILKNIADFATAE